MATARSSSEDGLIVCPYDPSHRVRENRLSLHVSKCHKHGRRALVVCKYNGGHLVPADALYQHLATCPDRCSAHHRQRVFYSQQALAADDPYPIKPVEGMPEPEESWDAELEEDSERSAHGAHQHTEPFFKLAPPGLSRAQRRAF